MRSRQRLREELDRASSVVREWEERAADEEEEVTEVVAATHEAVVAPPPRFPTHEEEPEVAPSSALTGLLGADELADLEGPWELEGTGDLPVEPAATASQPAAAPPDPAPAPDVPPPGPDVTAPDDAIDDLDAPVADDTDDLPEEPLSDTPLSTATAIADEMLDDDLFDPAWGADVSTPEGGRD